MFEFRQPVQVLMQFQNNLYIAVFGHAVVLVLSPHFIRKKHPMAELRRALDRQVQQAAAGSAETQQQQHQFLCPVFHSITVEECCSSGFRQVYERKPWTSFKLQEPKPPADVLDRYAKDIQELCTITGLCQDQVGFQCGCLDVYSVMYTWHIQCGGLRQTDHIDNLQCEANVMSKSWRRRGSTSGSWRAWRWTR